MKIAIVGRPNVGKSALTNKIIGRRLAIVHDLPGVTRDRNYYEGEWCGKTFTVIDTGGIYNDQSLNDSIDFQKEIEDQVHVALSEADAIIFLTDGKTGLQPLDKELALMLRRGHQHIYLAVNKMESEKRNNDLYEFYNLGFETVYKLSAQTGLGVSDLLDEILEKTPRQDEVIKAPTIKVAIVGKPNVGKSSLLNTLIGKERSIVSPVSGTTRDSVDEEITRDKQQFIFIDTAGIRKKAKVNEDVEYYSVMRAIDSIQRSDIAILVLDAQELVNEQDQKIAGLIDKYHKACLIVVNKWDLIPKDSNTINTFTEAVKMKLKFLAHCPILFISAQENIRTYDIYAEAIRLYTAFNFRIKTSELNDFLLELFKFNPMPTHRGKTLKLYFANQTRTAPPTFQFSINNHKLVNFSFERFLKNRFREKFNLNGTPLTFYFKEKEKTRKFGGKEKK